MSQPDVVKQLEPTYTPTQTEAALEEFRQAGVVHTSPRLFTSKRMSGFNAEVYSTWIERWAANAAANYPVMKGSAGVSFLKNAAKGVPAIVVGIGPSLDDSILDLVRAPRHAVIIATDAALRPLARHGIKPDIVLNFDCRDAQPTMWDSLDTSPYVLLANSCTSPHTIAAWKGKAMFFNMAQSDDEFCTNILPSMFPYLGSLPNMGTVGNGAVYLAHYMGCSAIIGVGMDLCYREVVETQDPGRPNPWKYRCNDYFFLPPTAEMPDGAWEVTENKVLYDNDKRMAETQDEEIKGVVYRTDKALQTYRNSLVSNIGQLDIPFINCSGGVLTGLVPTMTLREALEKKCYAALEPGRTIVKHLRFLDVVVPCASLDWRLVPEARIFVPQSADQWSPNLKR